MSVSLRELIAPPFYKLHHEIKSETWDEIWLKGGRGSTKSTFVSEQILLGITQDSEANAVVCRRYQNELRDTVYGQFEWTIARMGLTHLYKCQVSPMQIIFLPTGQKIVFKGADNPRKLKSLNLGRGYVKYAWFEELDQFTSMDEIRNVLQSLFRGDDKRRLAFYSYNPPASGRSWVNTEARTPKPGRRVHHSDYRDVPRHWLGERFIAEAEHLRQVNETKYRHEYLGEEVGTGYEVFTNVTLQSIPNHEIAIFDHIRQGLDFGYAVDPLCFERMHFDSRRRRLFFIDEIAGIGLLNREFFEKLKTRRYHSTLTVADSAEPKSIDELRSLGMSVQGARKGPGSVEHGIKWLQGLEQIIIDPARCPLAAKEFINYALETTKSGEVKSRFPDRDQHSVDSARYGLENDMTLKEMQFGTIDLGAAWR